MPLDLFTSVWLSTGDLYDRHHLDAKTTPPSQRRRFLNEEVLELIEASVTADAIPHKKEFLSEAADVLVTLVGLIQAHGYDLPDVHRAVQAKLAENDAKTVANGFGIINGKVKKLTPAPR